MATADLRMVARASGVSVSTASRALTGSPRVSEPTRLRVHEAAQELGYQANGLARGLRTARSRLVGLVVTNLANNSFRVVAEVCQRRLADAGYQLLLAISDGDRAQERAAIASLIAQNADGVILVGSDPASLAALRAAGLPVVHLVRQPVEAIGDVVLAGDRAGATEATQHLIGLGHVRIGFLGGPQTVTSGRERRAGFRVAMGAARLEVDDELMIEGQFRSGAGRDAVDRLWSRPVEQRPTALLLANHEATAGALLRISKLGITIPDQLSVVAYEDQDLLAAWQPAITVVDNHPQRMAERAADVLLARIDPTAPEPVGFDTYRIEADLTVRASTGRVG